MDLEHLKSEAEKVFSSEELSPVEKMKGIDSLIKPNFAVTNGYSAKPGYQPEKKEFFNEVADELRKLVRESAWGGSEPISLKEALDSPEMFDQETWDLLESWIDHDRDNNWNYVNLVQFNLKNNKTSDGKSFWLSPQHFRMAAIIDTVDSEVNDFDLDLAKSLYKNTNQIPQAIVSSVSYLRHS